MQKVRNKKREKDVDSVSTESWDLEPIEDVEGLQKVLEQYSSEVQKGTRRREVSSHDNQLKRSYKASVQLSNESEIRDFFEELISFLGKIPPLIHIEKKSTNINIENGKGRPSDDPNDPPEPNGPHLTITNVINIDISIGGKK